MRQAFNDVIYDTDTATLIARNELPDTIKYLKGHRNHYLYQMPDGAFFLYSLTESYFDAVSDPDPEITPLTTEQARAEYDNLEDRFADIERDFDTPTYTTKRAR
ncbi:MAG: hypothetical protein ACXVIG_04260 [Halobacteriota archaeon]